LEIDGGLLKNSTSRNFPSFIQAFLEYSKNVGASEKFLLWSAVSGVAAAMERKTWVHYNKSQYIYPNLYSMLVADSGVARKSTATRMMTEIIYELEDLAFMSTQLSAASLVEQLREAGENKTFEFEGNRYKNSSLFAYSSEAKVTIGDQKGLNGIQELLTDFYDCGDPNTWSTKKGWNKKTLSGGNITIYNPCLNFLACSTPAWLNEAIGKSGIEGGFASRVIFVTQRERVEEFVGWIDDDENQESPKTKAEMKEKLIQDLKQINSLRGQYRTTVGFKDVFDEFSKEINDNIDDATDMRAYYSRKMWHCMKLAQVLAADQSNELIITPDHLKSAKDLLESIEPDMYSAFSMKGENKNLMSLTNVWNAMRKKTYWDKQTLVKISFRHATASQLDEHLKTLREMGKIAFKPNINGRIGYMIIDNTPLG
jgi:hypothetical protein